MHLLPFLPFALQVCAGPLVLDSAGIRRPQVRLPEIASDWSPTFLHDRLAPDAGDGANAARSRALLRSLGASFRGEWSSDFASFRKRWPKSFADGTWPILVSAFWRTRPDQDLQSRPGLAGPDAPRQLREWTRWLESLPLAAKLSLADLTSQELSAGGAAGPTDLPVGGTATLDLSSARFDGPVRIRRERLVRHGLEFRLQTARADESWHAPAARPVWESEPLLTPGLHRFVWEADGLYQQALVRVGGLSVLAIPTDSGALVWARGGAPSGTRLVWKTRRGRVDSLTLDNSSPLHVGLPRRSDSGLVAVVSEGEVAVLRLRLPRPKAQERIGMAEQLDRWGLPVAVEPRLDGATGWQAATILERDAFDPGETLRASGWARRFDAYGRPDAEIADSVQWVLEPFSGEETRRWVGVDSSGRWADSVVVAIKGRVRVAAVAARGRIQELSGCDMGTIFRVRDVDNSCIEARPSPRWHAPTDSVVRMAIPGTRETGGLLALTQGRALDWKPLDSTADSSFAFVPSPRLPGGATAIAIAPSTQGWSAWRGRSWSNPGCDESLFPLTVATELPDSAKAGSPLPGLLLASRDGSPAPRMSVSVRIVPDASAAPLRPLCNAFGKARASVEAYTEDRPWETLGISEPEFQSIDRRREPDVFARSGIRAFPGLCIACGPRKGSWETKIGKAQVAASCGLSFPDNPCLSAVRPSSRGPVAFQTESDTSGELPATGDWPSSPGTWRIQAWGIARDGSILAWEQKIVLR